MHTSTLSLFLPLLPLTLASSSSTAPVAASTTSSSSSSVQTVTVGDDEAFAFNPSTITAAAGTTVEFHFFPPSHSVAQAEFTSPCAPAGNGTGFFSGVFTTIGGENANVFTLTINNTDPLWFYCSLPTHCESGMVGVINPPSDGSQTLAQFSAAAAIVHYSIAPPTVQGGVVGPAKGASSSSTSSSSTTSASGTRSSSTSSSGTRSSGTSSSGTSSSGTSSSSSASASSTTKSAGVEAKGNIQWALIAATGMAAVGVWGLIA